MLSFKENIPRILEVVEKQNPKSVLDIGAGMGKYGIRIREQYLSAKAEKGELEPVDDIEIDAVEDTEYLLKRIAEANIYNKIYQKSIFTISNLRDYDLILLIDVVEHWDKHETRLILRDLVEKGNVLVSTPKRVGMYKEHFYGDPRHHISQFTKEDFADFDIVDCSTDLSHIFLLKKVN